MKNVRNNLLKRDFLIEGKRISWKWIKDFFDSDSQKAIRMAPRLTKKHLEVPPFSAMRVNLAAQVLSHTVAAGICTYVDLGKMHDEGMHTAEFVKLIDGLFDIFNSRNRLDIKILRRPISDRSNSSHWPHLEKCMAQLKALNVVGSRSLPCISGWMMTINALKMLWSMLKGDYQFQFLCTSRLNQDALENLFSIIRGKGGHRDNPDPVHFQAAFKQVVVQNMFVPAPSANCKEDDDGQFLLEIDDFSLHGTAMGMKSGGVFDIKKTEVLLPVFGEADNVLLDDDVSNTLMYVAGFVCKKVLDKHDCKHCSATMLRQDLSLVGRNDLLCVHKAYSTSHNNFGGLKAASSYMFDFCRVCEGIFDSMFESVKHMVNVKGHLLKAIESKISAGDNKPCVESQRRAADIYMCTRLHYKLKFFNRDQVKVKAKKSNRKATKVLHK